MNKGMIALVALVVIAGAGYWFMTDYQKEGMTQTNEALAPNDQYMVGTWTSSEDAKFSREFKMDGTVIDRYQGDTATTETGTYATVDPTAETGFPVPEASVAGMSVIKIVFPKSGTMYFSINALTDSDLTMTNLSGRGNILVFTRVN